MQQFVILLGPPGSGKGTLSRLLIDRLGWIQLSTGNLCRLQIAQQTQIGKEIDLLLKSGKLVPDELIAVMVEEWLAEQPKTGVVLLDGYPRTERQARLLIDMIKGRGAVKATAIDVVVPDDVIIQRLGDRLICENKDCQSVYSANPASAHYPAAPSICDRCSRRLVRRPDDEPETVKTRLKVYYQHALPLVGAFKEAGIEVQQMNGDSRSSIEDTYNELLTYLAEKGI